MPDSSYKYNSPFIVFLSLVMAMACLLFAPEAWALTENYTPTALDYIFYTFTLCGVVFSAAIITAYREYQWLVYVLLAFLLIINVASMDGTLAHLIGENDFVIWVVPFLLSASIASYGYAVIALRLEQAHTLARFRKIFFALSCVSALFPLSSYFWLGSISLAVMWMPVNILFFGMILGQILPPLTWRSTGRLQTLFIRTFPIVVGLFTVGTYLVHFSFLDFTPLELNVLNRIILIVFAFFSMTIVVWQAFASAREKQAAELRALEAARKEAEMQLTLAQAESDYQKARSVAARNRTRLATVSHDLKQPISALRISIDHLQRIRAGQGTEKLARAVDYIDSLAQSYSNEEPTDELTDGVDENVNGRKIPVAIRVFADTLRQMFIDEALQRDIKLKIVDTDHWINVEPLSAMRTMTNLIANAISHADATRILVGFRSKGDKIIFQVHDNGCGMSPQVLDQALLPGCKGDTSTGQGLGLAIVQELCLHQNMIFTLESSPGRGTSATIELERISPPT